MLWVRVAVVAVIVSHVAHAGPQTTSCPYDPPLGNKGDFDIERIRTRDIFPLLPDHGSAVGATAVTASYNHQLTSDWGRADLQSTLLTARYGGRRVHPWLHASASLEIPRRGFPVIDDDYPDQPDAWPPRWDVGLGLHKISGKLGGYAHFAWGVRVNVGGAGDDAAFSILRPFDKASEDIPVRLTEEIRIGVAGCRAPFVHLTLEQRNYDEIFSTSYKIPVKAMVGLFPLSRLGVGTELGLFYDPTLPDDDKKLLVRLRFLGEVLVANGWRTGVTAEHVFRGQENGWIGQLYVQWLP